MPKKRWLNQNSGVGVKLGARAFCQSGISGGSPLLVRHASLQTKLAASLTCVISSLLLGI